MFNTKDSAYIIQGYKHYQELCKSCGFTSTVTQDQFVDMIRDCESTTDNIIASYSTQFGKTSAETLAIMYTLASCISGFSSAIADKARSEQVALATASDNPSAVVIDLSSVEPGKLDEAIKNAINKLRGL